MAAGAFDSTTSVSIRGNWNKTNALGIVPVTVSRATELAILPKRGGVYDPKDPHSWIHQPPTYELNGKTYQKVWCPQCGEWKAREQFYKNKARRNGLQSWCRKHDDTVNERVAAYRARQKLLKMAQAA